MTKVEMPRLPRQGSVIQFVTLPEHLEDAPPARRTTICLAIGYAALLLGAGSIIVALAALLGAL